MKSVLVLTSRQNFVWHSMQEIIPTIERLWCELNESPDFRVTCLDVDVVPLGEIAKQALTASEVVMTCFTTRLVKTTIFIREKINSDARIVFYLHSMATVGCWPINEWGLGKVLRESDIFVGTCQGDMKGLALSYENAFGVVIPFTSYEKVSSETKRVSTDCFPLVYVGRISEQKNLHALIRALGIFKEKNPSIKFHLDIFGAEDGLGSPNMDIYFEKYEKYLKGLACDVGVNEEIIFRGFVERKKIYQELDAKKYIYVSTSLHSDENFGMCVFRALVEGNQVVVSDWGGHQEYKNHFGDDLVNLVPTYLSTRGPWISPGDVVAALENAVRKYFDSTKVAALPVYFRPETIAKNIAQVLGLENHTRAPLRSSVAAQAVLNQRKTFLPTSVKKQKIFSSYSDPLAHLFFKAYGAIAREDKQAHRVVAPSRFDVTVDPHLGIRKI